MLIAKNVDNPESIVDLKRYYILWGVFCQKQLSFKIGIVYLKHII